MKFLLGFFLLIAAVGFFAANLSLGVFDDLFPRSGGAEAVEVQGVLKKQDMADFSLEELETEISTPLPLKIVQSVFGESEPAAFLSTAGVLQWTNVQRQKAGLDELEISALLNEIATRKVKDMFEQQYFAHVSPAGLGVSDLAKDAAYGFIAIGENLALGNYESDEALVQAWMDSPGHRANILGARYQEIGIALQQGLFEGKPTWLAVQVFALPFSACDFPDKELQEEIELGKAQIEEISAILEQSRAELEVEGPKGGPGYEKRRQDYNMLVDQYNALVLEIQAKVAKYNIQVQAFNGCAK